MSESTIKSWADMKEEKEVEPEYNYENGYNETNSIALVWCIDDIKCMAKQMEIPVKLTDAQCMDILYEVKSNHDPIYGVTWDTIEWNIEKYFDDYK